MLFTKYCASGTVRHMSTNGWNVNTDGHTVNAPCTSRNGFTEDTSMT